MRSSRVWMRSSRMVMRYSRVWMRSSRVWMRYSRVVRASGRQCQNRNSPGFDPSILRHSGIWGAADEAVLNNVHKKKKVKKSPLKKLYVFRYMEKDIKKPMSTCFEVLGNSLINFSAHFGHHTVAIKFWRKVGAIRAIYSAHFLGCAAAISASWQHPAWSRLRWGPPRGGSPSPGRPDSVARTRTACASPLAGGRSARPRRSLCPQAAPPGQYKDGVTR